MSDIINCNKKHSKKQEEDFNFNPTETKTHS